jgi:hypothetical protein
MRLLERWRLLFLKLIDIIRLRNEIVVFGNV